MYKAVKKNKVIRRYVGALAIYTGAPIVHLEDNKSCISVVEEKRVTPRVNHIDITVCFLKEQFENGLFHPKYEKSSVVLSDMCTKAGSGTIISRIKKWMTGFRFYRTSETENYQIMR